MLNNFVRLYFGLFTLQIPPRKTIALLITFGMKIIEKNAGPLTNFEVLDLLRSRGAGKDPTRVIASVSPSEFKVFDFLEGTVAFNQTGDVDNKMVEECKKYDLAKAEILNIVNIRPSEMVEIFPIIDQIDSGMEEETMDELKDAIAQILPPHPSKVNSNGEEIGADDNAEEPIDDQQAEPVE